MTVSNARQSKSDRSRIRSHATRNVLQKTDRILGQGGVTVNIENSTVPAPAFTNGSAITINAGLDPVKTALVDGFTTKSMLTTTALNYHELAHCMFMPRLDTKLVQDITGAGAFMTFNILQDQADETRFVKMYDPAKSYFAALVTQYMMESEEHLQYNYVLVSGRLFIPQRLRDKLADRFHKPKLIPEIDDLVARYKTLVFPRDQSEMFDVTLELHKLINDFDRKLTKAGTTHDHITVGEPDGELSQELSEQEEENYETTTVEGEDQEEQSEEAASSSKDEGEQEEDGKAQAGGAESEDAEEESGDNDAGGQSSGDDEQDLEDTLGEVFDELFGEVEEELEDRIEAIKDHESDYTVDLHQEHFRAQAPSSRLISTVDRCIEEFRQVSERHAPGWHISQRYGKLNHRQYAKALQGSEHVYRRWYEGVHDALDFEVVFLLDMSYSMQGQYIHNASESLWVLQRTFESLEGVVTVLGFSNGVYLLSQRGTPALTGAVNYYGVSGGTNVVPSLHEGKRILSVSQKPLKLCVVITDGDFNDPGNAMQVMSEYDDPISVIGIGSSVSRYDKTRNVVHTQTISDPVELVDVVKNLAFRLSDERLAGRN